MKAKIIVTKRLLLSLLFIEMSLPSFVFSHEIEGRAIMVRKVGRGRVAKLRIALHRLGHTGNSRQSARRRRQQTGVDEIWDFKREDGARLGRSC